MKLGETKTGNELLIFLASILCCIMTDQLLFTGLDMVMIPVACAIAVQTGIRKPLVEPAQIYRGWGLGGAVACVLMLLSPMLSPTGMWGSVAQCNASHRWEARVVDGFWMLIAMPAIAVICTFKGRRWKHDGSRLARTELILFSLAMSVLPIVVLLVVAMSR